MIIELIRKENKQRKESLYPSKKDFAVALISKIVLFAIFIAIECFIFITLDKKITAYSSYGTYDFLVLFLFVIMLAGVVASVVRARSTLFDHNDSRVSLILPIPNSSIIISKIIYIYIKEAITGLLFSSSVLICYVATRGLSPYYYIFSLVYPFIVSLFSVGISLILCVPYEYLYRLIKRNDVVQFIVASILMVVLCLIYKVVLDLFLTGLSDSSIGGVFSDGFISALHSFASYLFPVSNYLSLLFKQVNVFSNVAILVGLIAISLCIGLILSSLFYLRFNKKDFVNKNETKTIKEKKKKTPSQFMMLLKKEWNLLFNGTAHLFSYTALLVMVPFLSYVVISSLQSIVYSNLELFTTYFPNLVNGLNIVLILFFISVTTVGASFSIAREEKAIKIIKYIPVSPFKQLMAKILIPAIMSFVSLLLTLVVLVSTSCINAQVFFVTLFIGVCFIIFSLVHGLEIDMRDRSNGKIKLSFILPLFSIVFPLIILAIHFSMTFAKIPDYAVYLVDILMGALLLPSSFIKLNKRYTVAFSKMEVNS